MKTSWGNSIRGADFTPIHWDMIISWLQTGTKHLCGLSGLPMVLKDMQFSRVIIHIKSEVYFTFRRPRI